MPSPATGRNRIARSTPSRTVSLPACVSETDRMRRCRCSVMVQKKLQKRQTSKKLGWQKRLLLHAIDLCLGSRGKCLGESGKAIEDLGDGWLQGWILFPGTRCSLCQKRRHDVLMPGAVCGTTPLSAADSRHQSCRARCRRPPPCHSCSEASDSAWPVCRGPSRTGDPSGHRTSDPP